MTFSLKILTAFAALSILGFLSFVFDTDAQTRRKSGRKPSSKISTTITIPKNPKVGDSIRNSLGMELAWIPSGSFMMGSTEEEIEEAASRCAEFLPGCSKFIFFEELPRRMVTIREGFWMSKYEVTQEQYETVIGINPSHFKTCGKQCPVEMVSWHDAKEFIKRLNDRNDGFVYSLPTEAEWEYAARAGTTTAFAFGNSLSSTQANFNGKFPYGKAETGPYLFRTTKVGSYRPNAWGLYDMHGNVWEWVEDIYQDSYDGLPKDGSANTTQGDLSRRILRSGSWGFGGFGLRSAQRNRAYPEFVSNNGIRIIARRNIVSFQ